MTRKFAEMHRNAPVEFKGHVILDHDKYAFLRAGDFDEETRERDFSRNRASFHGEPTENPSAPNELLGRYANSESGVLEVATEAAMAQSAATEPGQALTLIAADTKGAVRAIATVPVEKVAGDDGRTLRDYQTATGGFRLFLVGDVHLREYGDGTARALAGLVASGAVTDFIYPDQTVGSVLRGMVRAGQRPAAPKVRGERVAEQSGPRFSVTSLLAGGDASREIAGATEPTEARIAELLKMAQGGARWSIVSALATQQDSTTTYTDSHGVKRTLHVVAGDRRHGWRKIAYKHCVDFGTARTGGFTLDELRRYEQSILNGGAKSYDKKTGRRTFKWKSPDGVTFTIGTYVEGGGKKAREVVNTVYTDRSFKKTKMLGTHLRGQAPTGQPSNNILAQAAGNVKGFSGPAVVHNKRHRS